MQRCSTFSPRTACIEALKASLTSSQHSSTPQLLQTLTPNLTETNILQIQAHTLQYRAYEGKECQRASQRTRQRNKHLPALLALSSLQLNLPPPLPSPHRCYMPIPVQHRFLRHFTSQSALPFSVPRTTSVSIHPIISVPSSDSIAFTHKHNATHRTARTLLTPHPNLPSALKANQHTAGRVHRGSCSCDDQHSLTVPDPSSTSLNILPPSASNSHSMKTHRITNSKHQAPETRSQTTIYHPPSALPFQSPPPPPSPFPMLSALIRILNLEFDSILYFPTVPFPQTISSPLSHCYCLKSPPQTNPQSPPLQSPIQIPNPHPFNPESQSPSLNSPPTCITNPLQTPPKPSFTPNPKATCIENAQTSQRKVPRKPAEKVKAKE